MSRNPYQTPQDHGHSLTVGDADGESYVYQPTKFLVAWLTGLFIAQIVLGLIIGVCSWIQAAYFPGMFATEDFGNSPEFALMIGIGCLGIFTVPVYITTVVVFCIWINRSNKNARSLGARNMQFTPGWCVGWWFIPFAHLFKPYQATAEIYRASQPGNGAFDWPSVSVSPILGFWWTLWIVSGILGNIEIRMALSSDSDVLTVGNWLSVFTSFLGIPTTLLAMKVVHMIYDSQQKKAGLANVV